MLKCCVVVAFLMLPSGVSAQSLFVQAGAGPDSKRFSDEAGQSAYDGTAFAVVFGIGQEIASHWVTGAEVDLGGRSTRSTTTDVVIISGQSRVIHNSYTSQRRTVAAVAGYRTAAHRRVRLGYYAGLAFTTLRREIASDAGSIVLQDAAALGLDTSQVVTSHYENRLTGPIVGVDAAVRVNEHFAIVPAVRVQGLTVGDELGGHNIRPSIGARISF